MVKKEDFPIKTETIITYTEKMPNCLSEEEKDKLKYGHYPKSMEDRWFSYYEKNKLYIHRSWSGICVYIIDFSNEHELIIQKNKNYNPSIPKELEISFALSLLKKMGK